MDTVRAELHDVADMPQELLERAHLVEALDAALADAAHGAGRLAPRRIGAHGATPVVAARLRAHGVRAVARRPRAATRRNPAGLTARELEVLSLLAAGLQNREIATRLVVSPKTVEHHVSAILRKLEVPTRRDAAAAAPDLGI